MKSTFGFHNFYLRFVNLRVSNPNNLIVDVCFFLTRCRISMCQGLGPNKHDDISEIDRSNNGELPDGLAQAGDLLEVLAGLLYSTIQYNNILYYTSGLHKQDSRLEDFPQGLGCSDMFFSLVAAKIFQGLGPKRRESSKGDRVYDTIDIATGLGVLEDEQLPDHPDP